jgi:hypothetical protein
LIDTEIINLEDVCVPHLGHGLHFPAEPFEHRCFLFWVVLETLEQVLQNDFYSHIPAEVELVGTVNFTHPTFADALDKHPFFIEDTAGFKQRMRIRFFHNAVHTSQAFFQFNFIIIIPWARMGTCALIFVQLSAVTVEKRSNVPVILFWTTHYASALTTASGTRRGFDAGITFISFSFSMLNNTCDLGDELWTKARRLGDGHGHQKAEGKPEQSDKDGGSGFADLPIAAQTGTDKSTRKQPQDRDDVKEYGTGPEGGLLQVDRNHITLIGPNGVFDHGDHFGAG